MPLNYSEEQASSWNLFPHFQVHLQFNLKTLQQNDDTQNFGFVSPSSGLTIALFGFTKNLVPLAWLCLSWRTVVSLLCNVSIGPPSLFVCFLIHVYFFFWPLTAVPPLKQRTIKAMLTVQLPRVNLFPIYCQVRRPDFY